MRCTRTVSLVSILFFFSVFLPVHASELEVIVSTSFDAATIVKGYTLAQELPSTDNPETNSVRALIHLPYARLAIFEEEIPEVDYGPDRSIHPDRIIDLDKVAFAKLVSLGAGLIDVRVTLIP